MVELDPDVCQDPELEGHEYGYCIIEQLPNLHIGEIHQLQKQEHFFERIWRKLQTAKLWTGNPYFKKSHLLMKTL